MMRAVFRLGLLGAVTCGFHLGCAATPTPHVGLSAALINSPAILLNVRFAGAAGDGKTLDTSAINRAIRRVAREGGGTLVFPAGAYLCHSLQLQNNVTLYLNAGATLLAAPPAPAGSAAETYDAPEPNPFDAYQDFGHSHFHNSLIWGDNLHDVAILGPGMIDGSQGLSRGSDQDVDLNDIGAGVGDTAMDARRRHHLGPMHASAGEPLRAGVGNKAIALKNCRNVIFRDFSVLGGGHFAILATGVDNFTLDDLKIDTNRDGMDIDSCRNVRISNCSVNSPWDDGICLKSDFALGYNRSCENVTITNCAVSGWVCGSLLDGSDRPLRPGSMPTGRIKFGTESNGGFKNIAISNCLFDSCRGLALESVDGAELEDVAISNITMRHPVNSPIFLRLGARMRGPRATLQPGTLQRVSIDNVVVYDADPRFSSIITGTPGQTIRDVSLSNLQIFVRGAGGQSRAWATTQPAEKESGYPEPSMFGETTAYGFYVRHSDGVRFDSVQLHLNGTDARPAFVLDDAGHTELFNVRVPPTGTPPLVIRGASSVETVNSPSVATTTTRPITP